MELLLNLLLLLLVVAGSIVFYFWCMSGYSATVSDEEVKRIQQERETEYQSEVDRLTDALMVAFDKVDKKKKRKSK
jgi:hypothetical protein